MPGQPTIDRERKRIDEACLHLVVDTIGNDGSLPAPLADRAAEPIRAGAKRALAVHDSGDGIRDHTVSLDVVRAALRKPGRRPAHHA